MKIAATIKNFLQDYIKVAVMITLSENFRALFYAPFYAAHAVGAYAAEIVEVELESSPSPVETAAGTFGSAFCRMDIG